MEIAFSCRVDEIGVRKRLIAMLNQLEKLKFVRSLPADAGTWEIRKLLKVRISIEELENLRSRLAASQQQ